MAAACTHANLSVLTLTLVLLVAPLGGEEYHQVENRSGRISGASHVNLRSGPGISHPPVTILKNGEAVHIETLEGSWYRVSLPQGQRGYIYQEFLEFLNGEPVSAAQDLTQQPTDEALQTEPPPEPAPVFTDVAKVKSPAEAAESAPPMDHQVPEPFPPPNPPEIAPQPLPSAAEEKPQVKSPPANPPFQYSILWAIAQWVVAPLCVFALGWIFGGNYYLRRDRIERNKLRF